MIELNTGIPGSGKTLAMTDRLRTLQARWERHPDESRSVFVNGIRDLKLPHSPVPLKPVQLSKAGKVSNVPDWDLIPEGSLVILDECQDQFPPRSSGSTPPEHVAFLNTHRHRGLDIWLTTQHPKLIDTACRALVGQHRHYRRIFGMKRSVVYEWDACSDSLSGMGNAVKSHYSFPANIYGLYKSAEIHTKQKFKLPLWVFIPFIGLALGLYAWPRMYSTLANGMSGKGIHSESSGFISGAAAAPVSSEPLRVGAVVGSKGAGVVAEVKTVFITACVASAKFCQCYDFRGVRVSLPEFLCRDSAERVNENFRFEDVRTSGGSGAVFDPAAPANVFNQGLNNRS